MGNKKKLAARFIVTAIAAASAMTSAGAASAADAPAPRNPTGAQAATAPAPDRSEESLSRLADLASSGALRNARHGAAHSTDPIQQILATGKTTPASHLGITPHH